MKKDSDGDIEWTSIRLPPEPGKKRQRRIYIGLPKRLIESDRTHVNRFFDALYFDPTDKPATRNKTALIAKGEK